jgi:hypothetical protein
MEGDPLSALVADPLSGMPAAPANWTRRLGLAADVAIGVTLLGVVLAPGEAAPALLIASQYVLGLALGGLAFVAFSYVTKAGWSVAIRRIPECFASTLPLGILLTLGALLLFPWLYEWSHAEVVARDAILQSKQAWLNVGFFWIRALVCMGVWLLFARALLGTSSRQDLDGDARATGRNVALSAGFLAAFALTFSVASFDWLMSLEPHWFSTVYAVYNFSGLFVSALSAILVVVIMLRRLGPLEGILRPDHVHDLARLLFGFTVFWAYIWFCQYMLIWYANLPEETVWLTARETGGWRVLTLANLLVNFLVPFLVLLPRPAKRSESIVLKVAVLLLVGRWLDLYLMVAPASRPLDPTPSLWDASAMVLALALFALALLRVLGRTRLVPTGDPMLEESLHHRT